MSYLKAKKLKSFLKYFRCQNLKANQYCVTHCPSTVYPKFQYPLYGVALNVYLIICQRLLDCLTMLQVTAYLTYVEQLQLQKSQ
jgi:hypothetical protein